MIAWIFVEGPSDRLGLEALWESWRTRLKAKGNGIQIVDLRDKAQFLHKFGDRAAEKLAANDRDLVVALPDLYPLFKNSGFAHSDHASLKALQVKLVKTALLGTQRVGSANLDAHLERLFPSAFKYDFEMLLLAAKEQLREALGTNDKLGKWRIPVEEQDHGTPPKRVVEELFRTKSPHKKSYLDTRDAPAVLRRVKDVASILKTDSGQCTCPEFRNVLQWLGEKLGVPCCDLV